MAFTGFGWFVFLGLGVVLYLARYRNPLDNLPYVPRSDLRLPETSVSDDLSIAHVPLHTGAYFDLDISESSSVPDPVYLIMNGTID